MAEGSGLTRFRAKANPPNAKLSSLTENRDSPYDNDDDHVGGASRLNLSHYISSADFRRWLRETAASQRWLRRSQSGGSFLQFEPVNRDEVRFETPEISDDLLKFAKLFWVQHRNRHFGFRDPLNISKPGRRNHPSSKLAQRKQTQSRFQYMKQWDKI